MKGYKFAIGWIVLNDDINDIDFAPTPTMLLVADLYGKSDEKILQDIKKRILEGQNRIAMGCISPCN